MEDKSSLEYGVDEIILYRSLTGTRRIRFVKNGAKVDLYYYCSMRQLSYDFNAQIRFA